MSPLSELQSEETGVICVWVIRGIILAIVAAAGIVVAVVAQRWYRWVILTAACVLQSWSGISGEITLL